MKKFLIILLSATLFSCHSHKETSDDNLLTFRQFPLPVPEQNSLMSQWENKNVLDSRLIDDMETETGWKVTGIGDMTYTTDRSKDGKKSLRFRTSLRDEEHYKKNRTEWDSFGGTQGGNASVQLLFTEPQNWIDWYSAAVLHSEYFMKRGSLIAAPYYHLPNSVWKESDIIAVKDSAVRSDMLRQFNDGTRLCSQYVLRTFPIYRDGLFHGSTNIQMSSAWALAEASRLRRDPDGMSLLGKQLEWIFGANPFGQSLMYGTGYRFAPHFAYCLKDIVGSLPVGMDCMNGDMPHWCATNPGIISFKRNHYIYVQ